MSNLHYDFHTKNRRKEIGWKIVEDIHKDIFFYTYIVKARDQKNKEWFNFRARFSYGKLDSIIRINE